jgi:zinc protease
MTVEVERASVDGIPAFLVASPGRAAAGVLFGVGLADEPLYRRGITHMVEHVVLAEVGRHAIDYDGMVDANSTAFYAVGAEDDVVRFMSDVAAGLHSPPFHQLERERSILKTESVRFGSTAFSHMCQLRFGNRSFGRLDWPEYGLDTIAQPDLNEWLASYFHTGRAAIWIDAEDPDALAARLEFAIRIEDRQIPDRTTAAVVPTPTRFDNDNAPPIVSYLGTRSVAALAAMRILAERLTNDVRYERGLAYHVASDYQPLAASIAHAFFTTDCLPDKAVDVGDTMRRCIDGFADDGPTAAEVERYASNMARIYRENPGAMASATCHDHVLGVDEPQLVWEQDFEELDERSVLDAFRDWIDSALFETPAASRPWERAPTRTRPKDAEISGTNHRTVWDRETDMRLALAPQGATLRDGEFVRTVYAEACAARLVHPGGLRVIVGENGTYFTVRAAEWRNDRELFAELDRTFASTPAIQLDGDWAPEQRPRGLAARLDRLERVIGRKLPRFFSTDIPRWAVFVALALLYAIVTAIRLAR